MRKLVLYADDDADDKAWVSEACQSVAAPLALHFVKDGREVFDYLKNGQEGLPALIILDLNMPRLDGRQTLQQLKAHPSYCHIPVAIVSTSSSRIDREVCQRLGAAVFLVKPSSYASWETIIHQLLPLAS